MNILIDEILGESMVLEKRVGDLYRLFGGIFPEDVGFWNKLADEEDYHSVIMHSAKDHFFEEGLFPVQALDPDVENIRKIVSELEATLLEYRRNPPTKPKALERALQFEQSSGEYYLSLVINAPADNPSIDLLQNLVGENKNHSVRIEEMIRKTT